MLRYYLMDIVVSHIDKNPLGWKGKTKVPDVVFYVSC